MEYKVPQKTGFSPKSRACSHEIIGIFLLDSPVFIVSLRLHLFVLIYMKNSMLRIFGAAICENAVG